jgi:hypothetical protein
MFAKEQAGLLYPQQYHFLFAKSKIAKAKNIKTVNKKFFS